MLNDIKNLLKKYKADLSAMKDLRYGFSNYDSSFTDGEEAVLERIIDDLQDILSNYEAK